jgi:hypothetical protein
MENVQCMCQFNEHKHKSLVVVHNSIAFRWLQVSKEQCWVTPLPVLSEYVSKTANRLLYLTSSYADYGE